MTETKLSQSEVADLVARYRKASKSLRGLKTDHFGNTNVDTASRHIGVMIQVGGDLTRGGHEDIANLLSRWHSELKEAQYDWMRPDLHRSAARRLTGHINGAVERLT